MSATDFLDVFYRDREKYSNNKISYYFKYKDHPKNIFDESKLENITQLLKEYMDYWVKNINTSSIFDKNNHFSLKITDYEKFLKINYLIHKNIYENLFNEKYNTYTIGDFYNTQDYCFQNAINKNNDQNEIYKILDFGAGYGRNLNIYSKTKNNLVYVAVDAMPKQYLLQKKYFEQFNIKIFEYFDDCQNFNISNKAGIYHIPSWRLDLLPQDFFDRILAINVLTEIDTKFFYQVIKKIHYSLKDFGSFYIRDHSSRFIRMKVSLIDFLRSDFHLEFCPLLIDTNSSMQSEVHGVPLLFAKKPKNYNQNFYKETFTEKIKRKLSFYTDN